MLKHSELPSAFCVKCQQITETIGKKTIVLKNEHRAMRGTCARCRSEVYRILPQRPSRRTYQPPMLKAGLQSVSLTYFQFFLVLSLTSAIAAMIALQIR